MGRVYSNGTVFEETKERCVRNFWKKVEKTDSCWIWKGAKSTNGYGCFGTGKFGSRRAHRFSWELINPKIPEGFCLCHHCDNPSCVNPEHLFIGSHIENMKDAVKKKRFPSKFGLKNCRSKWSDEKICEMVKKYNEGIPLKKICSEFGISEGNLDSILYAGRRSHALKNISISKIKRTPDRKGEKHPRAKLISDQVLVIRKLYSEGKKPREIMNVFPIPEGTFWRIISRSSWKHI